jgi:aryl-alcohol dehydrogenase-like predicted oxidoreductase
MINLQLPYSLVQRQIEMEHVAMAQTLGLGITAWSPLGGGFLSAKYRYAARGVAGDGRLSITGASGLSLTDRDWQLLKPLERVARELGVTMAQVATNWVATQPGIASAIVGASSADQLGSTMAALDFELPVVLRAELDRASEVTPESVYRMFTPGYQNQLVSPGVKVGDKPAGYLPGIRNWVREST